MSTELSIDIFSDPACPWCLLGLTRLDKALADLPDGSDVVIRHHPYLLDANTPPQGVDVAEMLKTKYGSDPAPMWDRLEAEAKASGIALDMRKQKMRHPTQKAELLIMAATNKGTQHKLARAMSDAYYLDALNISDTDVLIEVAAPYGFTAEEVTALVNDEAAIAAIVEAAGNAGAQGVQGVPFFVLDGKYALSGAQPEAVFSQALNQVLAEKAA